MYLKKKKSKQMHEWLLFEKYFLRVLITRISNYKFINIRFLCFFGVILDILEITVMLVPHVYATFI